MTENNHTESHELLTKQVADLTRKLDAIKNVLCQAKEILTLEEAAIFLGISKSCLYKMTHNQVQAEQQTCVLRAFRTDQVDSFLPCGINGSD